LFIFYSRLRRKSNWNWYLGWLHLRYLNSLLFLNKTWRLHLLFFYFDRSINSFLFLLLILSIGTFPTILFLLWDHRQIFLFPLHHYSLALEEIIYQQITNLFLEDITRLVVVFLPVNRAPIAHVFHRKCDGLRERSNLICILKHIWYSLEIENQTVHPNRTRKHILIVFQTIFMTIVHKSTQSLKSVSLWNPILQYNSSEYLLSLILRMGTLIHQIVLFIFIEQTN
jgi:hypothetical protein